ncbi:MULTISPECIES: LLM class flavin-dependent oxidoreductase [Pseudomonas]|uniref:LLM class flavin-dependent oxidoreductase n=1 Tax=Pseudomonas TaxID=286 RepID=UPI0015B2F661|nr:MULTISPECIES: LLM class flavin-dependent oxidoreductase [Pseudomonas]
MSLKPLHVNLFEMSCVSHITHGLWTHPDNNRHRFNDLDYWIELAQLLERGGFDAVFLADVTGTYDAFRNGPETALREGMQIPSNDPLMVVSAMAAVTRNLGFGVTFSTTYEPPFSFARRMSTLDHLTKGRMGWNIVTSYLPNAARNFGHEGEVAHDRRYEIADEYLDVLYKLWEGSWDDDAVIQDREQRVYTDPGKVRYINHEGEHFKVAGPHLCQPSRQRTPVLFQATGSPAGIEFAGRHAEVVFTGGRTHDTVRRNIATMRAKAVEHGRRADSIKFLVMASVIVAETDIEVARKVESYRERLSVEGSMAHFQMPIDLLAYPRDELIEHVFQREQLPSLSRDYFPPGETVGQALDRIGSLDQDFFFVAGTPTEVADTIEKWLDEDGIDGINLRQFLSFETARDFIDLVIPELRRRGRFRQAYEPGETLRERLFGKGNGRLPAEHFATRYRDAQTLKQPAVPLRFT